VKDRILLTALVVAVVTSGTVVVVGAPVGGADATTASATTADTTFTQQQRPPIKGSPELDANVPSPRLTPGEINQVTVQITNDGDVAYGPSSLRSVVTTARNVRVKAKANGPLTVESGTIAIGSVTESRPGEATFAVRVPEGIDPGEYDLKLDVEYSYTKHQTTFTDDNQESEDFSVGLEVSEDARFEIVEATTDAQVGDTGTLEATIKNTGSETARDINVGLESMSAGLSFGSGIASDSSRLGELEPNETGTVTYDVGFAPNTPIREYVLDGTVSFETPDGLQRVDDGPTTSVSPVAEQQFSIRDIESDLYVGESGHIRGTVTNQGPLAARNVVVKYAGQSPNIVPLEDSVAVGTLEAGASGEFRLPIEVSSEAEAITRSANIVVQYRDDDFDSRVYQELELLFDVDPKRDRFDVEVTNRTIEAGGTRTLSVDVTNNLNETVSDVEARMFADDPMSTGNTDTGYVQSIDPGETVTMRFDLAASGSATPGSTYPISFDLRFDDSDGDSQLSNTIRAPVDVTESADNGFSLPFIGGSLLTALAAVGGVVWYRRQ